MSPSRPHAPRPSGGTSSRPSGRNSRPNSGQVPASGSSSRGSVAGTSRPTPGVSPGSAARPQRPANARPSAKPESAKASEGIKRSDRADGAPQGPRKRTSVEDQRAKHNPAMEGPVGRSGAGTRESSGSNRNRVAENVTAYEVGAPLNRSTGFFHNVSVRLVAIAAVVIVAVVIITPVARNYMKQYNANAEIQQQIAEQQAKNDALRNDVSRWEDDSYVIAQARERLTFIFPGETPYRVMGWDPEDVAETNPLPAQQPSQVTTKNKGTWYEEVFGSIAKSGELARQNTETSVEPEPEVGSDAESEPSDDAEKQSGSDNQD